MLLTVITGSSIHDVSFFLIVSSAAKWVKIMQLISDSSLSAWSSQVNFLISEWCSLPLPHRHTHTHITPQSKSWTALKADHLGWKHKSVEECRKENGTWRFANCYFWFQRAPVELALLIFPSLRLWLTTPHPPIFFMFQISSWEFSRPQEINLL